MTVTIADQMKCVRRELAMRQRVYPKWVEGKRYTQEQAEKELSAMQAVHDTLMEAAGEKWRPIETAPAPDGYIDNWPSFFGVYESTLIRYAADEGEAIAIVRARLNLEESRWEPYAWLPIAKAPKSA
jgi:hypothetical protein